MCRFIKVVLLSLPSVLLLSGVCFAAGSGAYRLDVSDARALSMGGAFVSVADSPAALFYNQAGMTQIKQPQVSANLALVQPKAHAQAASGQKTKLQQDSFLIPSMSSVMSIGERTALGVGIASSWGLSTDWAQDYFGRYTATHTSMKNEDYLVAVAYKITDQFSMGVGATIDNSQLEQSRKLNQGGADGNFKLKGDDVAAGFQISGLYKLNERHQFGVQYASEIHHTYTGKVHLDDMNGVLQGAPYNFNTASYETRVVAKSTLPQSLDIGYTYQPTLKLSLNMNVVWMGWSAVKEEALSYPDETATSGHLNLLLAGYPVNYDYHNAWSLGLGTEYKATDRLRLRGGYYFHQSPVPQDTWNPSVPDANSHSVAMGLGYDVTKALTMDLAYSAMFYDTRSISNQVGSGSINGKYSQWTNMVVATMTYKF